MANFKWKCDRNMTVQNELERSEVSFSDGYSHKMTRSINPQRKVWNLSFKNRPKAQIEEIEQFFIDLGGVYNFTFVDPDCEDPTYTYPDDPNAKRWTVECNTWNTTLPIGGIQSLTCVFKSTVL